MIVDGARVTIRAHVTSVGSEYRKEVISGMCDLCICEWTRKVRDIGFRFTDVDDDQVWDVTILTIREDEWNDIWEVCVNLFPLSNALRHVIVTVDQKLLGDCDGFGFIAHEINELAAHLDRVADIIERLDGAYIYNTDKDSARGDGEQDEYEEGRG
ncbi:hypothetical protein ADJ76_08595 [Schaalia meyeri]|nr:hypothetical protein ADJ76_08595 [Schaalia meyeri]